MSTEPSLLSPGLVSASSWKDVLPWCQTPASRHFFFFFFFITTTAWRMWRSLNDQDTRWSWEQKKPQQLSVNNITETDHEILLIDLSRYQHFVFLCFVHFFASLLWYGAADYYLCVVLFQTAGCHVWRQKDPGNTTFLLQVSPEFTFNSPTFMRQRVNDMWLNIFH